MSKRFAVIFFLLIPLVLLVFLGCSSTQQSKQTATPIATPVSTCPPGEKVTVRETVLVKETVIVTQTLLVLLVPTAVTTTPTPVATSTQDPTPTTVPTQVPPAPTQEQVSIAAPTSTPSGPSTEVTSYLLVARTQNGNFFNILNSQLDFIYYEPLVRDYVNNYYAWAVASKPTLLQIRAAIDASTPPAGMEGIKVSQQAACTHLETAIEQALGHNSHYTQEVGLAYTSAMQAEDALNQYPK